MPILHLHLSNFNLIHSFACIQLTYHKIHKSTSRRASCTMYCVNSTPSTLAKFLHSFLPQFVLATFLSLHETTINYTLAKLNPKLTGVPSRASFDSGWKSARDEKRVKAAAPGREGHFVSECTKLLQFHPRTVQSRQSARRVYYKPHLRQIYHPLVLVTPTLDHDRSQH